MARAGTVYETVFVVVLPARSTAVTVNVRLPATLVSSSDPFGAVPTQDAMSAAPSSSEQVNETGSLVPCTRLAPSDGTAIEMAGPDRAPVSPTDVLSLLRAVSVAVTVNVFAPAVLVSIAEPLGTLPVQVTAP